MIQEQVKGIRGPLLAAAAGLVLGAAPALAGELVEGRTGCNAGTGSS